MDATCAPLVPDDDPRFHALDLRGERVAQRLSVFAPVVPRAGPRHLS